VSHTGRALLRQLADKTGLTGGLSRALASPRLLIHDRGRVTADLACAIADGSEVISDFRVLTEIAAQLRRAVASALDLAYPDPEAVRLTKLADQIAKRTD